MMAKADLKTIIIGLDLRKPKIFGSFGLTNVKGISNVLSGNMSLNEVIYETQIKNLDFISAGPVPPNPNELILRDIFKQTISVLKEKYDRIIIDSPPSALVSDAFEVGKFVDVTFFVLRHQQTHKQALKYINDINSKKTTQ